MSNEVFKIGDLIVDKNLESRYFKDYGVGMIMKKEPFDDQFLYEIEFSGLQGTTKYREKDLITHVGIGNFEHYPVKKFS